jgi:hypothetical protein
MRKSHLKPEAEMLYLQGNTYEQIEMVLGVSKQTLSRWAQKGDWREKRDALQKQPLAISQKISMAFSNEFDRVLQEGFTTANTDILCKIAAMQSRMGMVDDFPSSAVTVGKDKVNWILAQDDITDEQKNFLFEIEQRYLSEVKEREFGRNR